MLTQAQITEILNNLTINELIRAVNKTENVTVQDVLDFLAVQ